MIGGFVIRAYLRRVAEMVLPYFGVIINVSLVGMILLVLFLYLRSVISVFGTGAILAAILLLAGSFAIGYFVGTFDKSEKTVLGFATAQRNFAAANVVAVQAFTDSGVLVMTVVISIVALLLIPLSWVFGKRSFKDADAVVVGVKRENRGHR